MTVLFLEVLTTLIISGQIALDNKIGRAIKPLSAKNFLQHKSCRTYPGPNLIRLLRS